MDDRQPIKKRKKVRNRAMCRLRFYPDCTKTATKSVLHCPAWLGGTHEARNQRRACAPCATTLQEHREWATQIFRWSA